MYINLKELINRKVKYYCVELWQDTLINGGNLPKYFKHGPSTASVMQAATLQASSLISLQCPVNTELEELGKVITPQK